MARKSKNIKLKETLELNEQQADRANAPVMLLAADAPLSTKFDNQITTPFAANGLKQSFPDEPAGDGLINQSEGFTLKYRTPINAGGAYIKMENFNEIINKTQLAIKEVQDKAVTSVNGAYPDDVGNISVPRASETVAGIAELATVDETVEGTNNISAITPYALYSAGYRPGFGVFVGGLVSSAADRGAVFDDGGGWWLRCDGKSRYNKVDFPELAELLGSIWGAEDSDTFALPDFTSRAAIGAGSEFPFGTVIQDTMQKMTGKLRYSFPSTYFIPVHEANGVFRPADIAPAPGSASVGSIANYSTTVNFDNSLVARTSAHTQTRGLAIYYYIFAGKKATTPPPQDVFATTITALTVKLTWQPPVSGGTPTGYMVYSSAQPFAGYSLVAEVAGLSWTDTEAPLTTSLRYYKVSAVFDGGRQSGLSDPVSSAFLIAPVAPVVEVRAKDVLITMNVPDFCSGSLQQSTNGTDWTTVREPSGSSAALILPVGSYYFRYRLFIGDVYSADSSASSVVNIVSPVAPVLTINTATKTVTWTNPNNSGKLFEFYVNGSFIGSTTGLSYHYPAMSAGATFFIKSWSGGMSAQSNNAYYVDKFVFAGTIRGIYRSADGVNNWVLL